MDIDANRAVGRALEELRYRAHINQRDLATALDKPQSYISKLENGERALRLYEVYDYCRALGVDPGDLLVMAQARIEERRAWEASRPKKRGWD